MKASSTRTNGSVAVKRNQLVTVSERKLKANRENSKKSTGPKTPRGKAYSGRNALKHGIFARQFMDFIAHGEDPEEWEELLNGLRRQYQPIGKAEELEVDRVAHSWWRLKRIARYENATNRVALRDIGRRERTEQAEYCKTLEKEEEAVMLQLRGAVKQIEVSGEISQELKQKIFELMPGLDAIWPVVEQGGQEMLNTAVFSNKLQGASAQERASALAVATATFGIHFLQQLARVRESSVTEVAVAQHLIPDGEVLDKILRYETTMDRNLTRALDRLERLQRRRKGEPVPRR